MSEQDDVLALAQNINSAGDRELMEARTSLYETRILAREVIRLTALTSPAASGVKLLSREPTEEMREASTATFREELASHRAHGVSGDAFMGPSGESYWQAMWDAALQSPPESVIHGIDYGDSDRTFYHDGRGNEVDPPAPGVVQPANPEMLVLAKAAVDAPPDTRPVEQWANEWANDLARAPCDPAFGKINTSAQVFKSAPSQEGHAAGVASDVHLAPVSKAQIPVTVDGYPNSRGYCVNCQGMQPISRQGRQIVCNVCAYEICTFDPATVSEKEVEDFLAGKNEKADRILELERKLAEAEKEAARLDWMERNQALISVAFDGTWTEVITVGVRVGIIGRDSNQLGVAGRWRGATLREAIDAARATETGGRDERNVSGM